MKALSTLAITFSSLLLQGCSAIVVGSAAIMTKTAIDPRTIGTQVDDNTLELRINNALAKDKKIKNDAHITATTYQGKVLLTGEAPNTETVERAKQIALGICGCIEVYNEIRKGSKISFSTISSDTWITTKVRTLLLSNEQIKSPNVKVITENGEVFLMGIVTQEEANISADIASRVSGVRHVITIFTILK